MPSTTRRLMLPYLAFAGPVTVMMALLNAQGRFALTAFSPLLFNIALIAVMAVLLLSRQDAADAAQIIAATVGVAGLLQLSMLVLRRGGDVATPLRYLVRQGDARLSRQGGPRHDRQQRAAIAHGRRRDHRVVIAVGGVLALFRQPPDRTAARHRRRRHGHGADPGTDARGARRRPRRRSRTRNRAASNSRSAWRCRRRSA